MSLRTTRFTFLAKLIAAPVLVAAADVLFQGEVGSWLGLLALGWALLLAIVRPALRRGPALIALLAAMLFALALTDDAGPLAWVMFWAALSMAALLPRTSGFDDAWRWAVRLVAHGATGPLAPLLDLSKLFQPRPHRGRMTARGLTGLLALPLIMSALFVGLFASANPLIAKAFANIRLPSLGEIAFWLFVLAIVWPSLRPRAWATRIAARIPEPEVTLPGASMPSVLISLALFNLVFAVENGLDVAFLWSGAALPAGMSVTEYVHRGAYPLILTALLAGLFVLAALKPGSATAASPMIRRLLVLWVAQNLFLVASSALRTIDYIDAYMLTPWRIAALLWMALVALGLALICWRMLRAKSARWLINANALAAAIVLAACTVIDFDAASAWWNVRHAREVGGYAAPLDLCLLNRMGAPALLPLIELEGRPLDSAFRDRVRAVRQGILQPGERRQGVEGQQADWHSWIWRDARRLAKAHRLLGSHRAMPRALSKGETRLCNGAIYRDRSTDAAAPPAPIVATPPAPGLPTLPPFALTPAPEQ